MKKILSVLEAILLVCLPIFALCACQNGEGGPDSTAENTEEQTEPAPEKKMLSLWDESGKTDYIIVRPDVAGAELRAAATLLFQTLDKQCEGLQITTDWDRNPLARETEILVGETTRESADGFSVDWKLLGEEGYLIKVVGTRIFITGGSEEGTVAAVNAFLDLLAGSERPEVPEDLEITYSPTAYAGPITVGGVSLADFALVYPEGDTLCETAALAFRRNVFAASGTLLSAPVTSSTAAHQVLFARAAGDKAVFEIRKDGANLTVSGTERAGLSRGIRDYFAEFEGNKTLDFDAGYTKDYGEVVTYEDFGAKGDGKTDDMEAIYNAHQAANAKNVPVLAREDATYYIGGGSKVTVIQTDADWSCAHFIIDDTNPEKIGTEIFRIPHSGSAIPLSVSSLREGQENIGVKLPGDCIVTAVNSNVKQYIREGANQNDGASMTDIFLVHADGTVDPAAPIMWNFDTVTSISGYLVEQEPLTVKGGIITTIANKAASQYNYHYRGIRIYRSNVTFDGLEHYVTGEGATGAPYYGILIFHTTVNDVVKNVTFTGHKTYKTIGSAGSSVSMGSYDITVTNSLGFTALHCRQTNQITDANYWGVFASNYSKNITFDDCVFSRFDAHQGVYNVTLKNCSLGHQGINLIGRGTALIENCTVYCKTFVNLRSDYGSTWRGDLIIRNSTYIPNNGNSADAIIIGGSYNGTHDFGYTCYLPQNVIIDGLDIRTTNSNAPAVFANINKNWKTSSYVAKYPMVMPQSIQARNVTVANGKSLVVSSNMVMFSGYKIDELTN